MGNWEILTEFVEKHRGELVLDYFEVLRLDNLLDIPDDDYYYECFCVNKGRVLVSCVGWVFPLKGHLPDKDYNEIKRVFDLNVEWKHKKSEE